MQWHFVIFIARNGWVWGNKHEEKRENKKHERSFSVSPLLSCTFFHSGLFVQRRNEHLKTWRLAGLQVRMNEILESLNPLLTMREKQQRQEEAESSSELWTSLSSFPCCFTLCSLGKIEQIFNISLISKPLSFLFSLRLFFSSPQLRLRNLFSDEIKYVSYMMIGSRLWLRYLSTLIKHISINIG